MASEFAVVREEIENYWRKEHRKRGYEIVYTPHIAKSNCGIFQDIMIIIKKICSL